MKIPPRQPLIYLFLGVVRKRPSEFLSVVLLSLCRKKQVPGALWDRSSYMYLMRQINWLSYVIGVI